MEKHIARLGFYASITSFIAAVGFSIAQILQVLGILKFPFDAIFIYGFSLFIATPFILSILALHYSVQNEKKIWTHAALIFAVIYTIFVTLNYVVQLTTVIPMTLKGTLGQNSLLDQTPHSLFWDVDALGYIFMGLSTLFASFVFVFHGREKWLKIFLLINALITPIIALVYFYPTFSYTLLMLASPWIITVPGSLLLLTLFFKRKMNYS